MSDNSVWKLEYKYGELESGSVNASKNTGNIARSVTTLAGVANPIVQNYKYDPLYRLTEAGETAGAAQNWIQNFGYDRFGNRTAFSQTLNKTSGAVQTTATPLIDQATNRFVTTNQNFRYDKNGNLTTDGDNRGVVFNGENKQYEVKNASGQTIGRYLYDGEGKRVKKITWNSQGASETTIFVYSAGKLVAEYSDTQVPVPNKTTRYLTEDHLGTPRVITDSEGNVISRRDFLPFGEEITPDIGSRASVAAYQPANDNVKQKFTGYQKDDEAGLDFAEARMYENRHGRFTAVDPLLASGKSANPQTFNRFVYCVNSPLGCVDPTGLDGERRWYSTTNPDLLKEKCDNRCTTYYQAFEESPGEKWNDVSFENGVYHVISGSRIGTQYLYADGTSDGGSRARWFDEWASFTQATRDYCRIDPKCIGVRDPEFAARAGDAMWSGAAVYNGFAGTYNLGAWGANSASGGDRIPYAPILSPDENTSGAGKFFYYGTNGAMLVNGGANVVRSLANLRSISLYRAISASELRDIAVNGLRTKRGGYESVKLFATSVDDATRFGRNNFRLDKIPNFVLEVRVPSRVFKMSEKLPMDGMKAVAIPANQLRRAQARRVFMASPLSGN
ncbi:MAG: RHS repeat protein [Acidobacteria bacterium]|nr:RHS repeat protein [Acidobacteriota bacterium]